MPWRHMKKWMYSPTILDLCTRWWSVSRSGHFTSCDHWIGGCMVPTPSLNTVSGKNLLFLLLMWTYRYTCCLYCHMIERLYMGFGLVIGFIGLWYSALLHFTLHCYTHTSVHSHIFTSRCLVTAFNGEHSHSSGFLNGPRPQLPANHSYSSMTEPQQLSKSLINQLLFASLTQLLSNCPAYFSTNCTENTVPLLLFMGCCLVTAVV
jgi:hypothetical protein